ncbi:MAG: sodium:calcium symporter, partial [Verrucomicrobiae bacterium]|nr:sodium:calcium symporter [Verrucomicrobiae bacterium]
KDPAGKSVAEKQVEGLKAFQGGLATATIKKVTIWSQLKNGQLWLAAAGQIFFSLSVGFGIILTYASYLRRNDDVVLSGLSACSANEFCEVGLGGLITLPAAVTFLGVSGVAGMGTFGLGFNVLPMVFANMPAGGLFGFLFFFLLFLAAVTSSLSMLQPGIAFLEEAMGIGRKMSVALLGFMTAVGCAFVVWFSKDVKALDTLDFWVGTFLIYILATIQVVLFSWVLGAKKGIEQANVGAVFPIPRAFGFILQWVTPAMLLIIFLKWLLWDVIGIGGQPSGYITDLAGEKSNQIAQLSVGLILLVAVMITLILSRAAIYKNELRSGGDADAE